MYKKIKMLNNIIRTRKQHKHCVDIIEIEYTFYDKDGNVIGVASDYLEELDEGKTWKFDVEYVGASSGDIISYELTGLEGF